MPSCVGPLRLTRSAVHVSKRARIGVFNTSLASATAYAAASRCIRKSTPSRASDWMRERRHCVRGRIGQSQTRIRILVLERPDVVRERVVLESVDRSTDRVDVLDRSIGPISNHLAVTSGLGVIGCRATRVGDPDRAGVVRYRIWSRRWDTRPSCKHGDRLGVCRRARKDSQQRGSGNTGQGAGFHRASLG